MSIKFYTSPKIYTPEKQISGYARGRRQTIKSGSVFNGQLYFQVGQIERPKVPREARKRGGIFVYVFFFVFFCTVIVTELSVFYVRLSHFIIKFDLV